MFVQTWWCSREGETWTIKHAAVRKPLKYVTPCPEKGQRASADLHRSHREETGAEITCNLVINGRLVLIEEDGVRLRPSSQTSAPVCVPAPRLRILSKSVRQKSVFLYVLIIRHVLLSKMQICNEWKNQWRRLNLKVTASLRDVLTSQLFTMWNLTPRVTTNSDHEREVDIFIERFI